MDHMLPSNGRLSLPRNPQLNLFTSISSPSMASAQSAVPLLCRTPPCSSFSSLAPSSISISRSPDRLDSGRRRWSYEIGICRAQQTAVQGASAAYAKEMERLSAKESLLLAFKDSGGFEALVTGKTTNIQKIDVNERITGLERLNPTPRPTTSPILEGRWNFEWFGTGSPGLFAAKFLFQRSPLSMATLSKLDALIKDGNAKITANLKLLNSVESKFVLSSKLSVEGPVRMKEEYVEGVFESPEIIEESIPEQLRGTFGQAVRSVQQFPVPIVRDALSSGLTIPLSGAFERLFMISYLDEEILIIRDTYGVPEVLTRLDTGPALLLESGTEYES